MFKYSSYFITWALHSHFQTANEPLGIFFFLLILLKASMNSRENNFTVIKTGGSFPFFKIEALGKMKVIATTFERTERVIFPPFAFLLVFNAM